MDLYLVGLLEKVDRYLNGRRKQVHAWLPNWKVQNEKKIVNRF